MLYILPEDGRPEEILLRRLNLTNAVLIMGSDHVILKLLGHFLKNMGICPSTSIDYCKHC